MTFKTSGQGHQNLIISKACLSDVPANSEINPLGQKIYPTYSTDMVKKAISQMKAGKAPSPSGIVVEMIRAAGDMGASMIRDLAAAIIRDGKVPSDWEQSFIVCLYMGKGDALERGNYRGLKLTEQVMKVLERIVDGLIRQVVSTDDSQFGFVPGRGTTQASH